MLCICFANNQLVREFVAGFLQEGASASNTVQCALSAADIALHDVVIYVICPPLDLSGSCGSGKQLRIMLSGYAPLEVLCRQTVCLGNTLIWTVFVEAYAGSEHEAQRRVEAKAV